MNEHEVFKAIEEEILLVVQQIDELGEYMLQTGEFNTEQYLVFTHHVRAYVDESQKIFNMLRCESDNQCQN